MASANVAIIAGTGVAQQFRGRGRTLKVPTRHGLVTFERLDDVPGVLLLRRHGVGHSVAPHRANYVAFADACARLGLEGCYSTAAVGSLRTDWPVGTLVVCSDFIDATGRQLTRFENEVRHTDFTNPFDLRLRQHLIECGGELRQPVQDAGVYVCTDGPRYETPAEVSMYRTLGGDVVGMTAGSEGIAMREAGVPYATLAIVTNLASGLSPRPLSHGEVEEATKGSSEGIANILFRACERLRNG
ncbi:MAG: MTAP family purine nucleoside phosphorylase [Armatimonadetes bacterium]|nr:S-methyl-5'-thioadenosine phosphorylase [Armatimonadota bacterium]NOG91681.1 MTAP family purine nucleoside phosphorylase [Armatimonadota bacterium]